MRRLQFLMLVCITFISCKTESKDAQAIVRQMNIKITATNLGCFANHTQTIKVFHENGMQILTSEREGLEAVDKRKVVYDSAHMKLLEAIIEEGLSLQDSMYTCMLQTTYTIVTEDYTCMFQDNNCTKTLSEKLEKLIED